MRDLTPNEEFRVVVAVVRVGAALAFAAAIWLLASGDLGTGALGLICTALAGFAAWWLPRAARRP